MDRGTPDKRKETLALAGDFAPIVQSALRLHDDAKVLRASRAYASAAALAILSIEEVGKFMLHHEAFQDHHALSGGLSKHTVRSHRKKQEMSASLLIGNVGIDEIDRLLGLIGTRAPDLKKGRVPWEQLTKSIGSIDKKHLGKNKSKYNNHYAYLIDIAAGRFDSLKQRCFYSDVDNCGRWTDASVKIDRATSDKVIKMSQVALNRAYSELKHHKWRALHW